MSRAATVLTEYLQWDFLTFTQRCFAELHGGEPLPVSYHLELMAERLHNVLEGKIRRSVINVPPRHLKSIMASVAFPAFCFGWRPTIQIICVSYGQDIADKHARDCRTIMNTKWYRDLFGITLTGQRAQELVASTGGVRYATSIGGTLTGRGADIIIIDDPHKSDEVLSEPSRRSVIDWLQNTAYSRLNDKKTGRIVLVMQRLHEEDLAGAALAQGGWDLLRLPAIAEQDEEFKLSTYVNSRCLRRRKGEALDPIRQPLETLAKLRAETGEYNFASQYQQAPVPASGGMVKRAWFRTYRPAELPPHLEIVQSWDTASKAGEFNDYSVCTTWGIAGNKAYLIHVHRDRHEYPSLKRAVREQQQIHRASVVLIEDKSSGIQLAQELFHEGLRAVQRYSSQIGKFERMHAQTGVIENGLVLVPESEPWLDAYLHELTLFPRGKHDDQVDSTSQFLEWLKQRSMSPRAMFGSYGR
ncbi:phage terminase large subunit [Enterovirga rhinocerotis]|uniref:Putative phage terminase large subunit-like protein n=1 Tax=Enterovirga rhinocerotis TaxID=1339210 RepID=A0A4R7BGW0_9HYPH|nr:phage terminase large subunit [Enterovirga rhinocerotis]TDR84490.1 putative phage terminase large subunit-like protein [Enterovirga rhinocerotis]